METLRYKLTGRPVNLDDCRDYARGTKPLRVCVHLETNELIREWFFITQYVAAFTWTFENMQVVCRPLMGGHVAADPMRNRHMEAKARDKAEQRLAETLQQLAESGVQVERKTPAFVAPPVHAHA